MTTFLNLQNIFKSRNPCAPILQIPYKFIFTFNQTHKQTHNTTLKSSSKEDPKEFKKSDKTEAMLRAMSVRRSRRYERLVDESTIELLEVNLKRAKSVPASRVFGEKNKLGSLPELSFISTKKAPEKPAGKKAGKSITHPLFSLFDGRRKRKTTAKPEFARYLEYVKEGGLWDTKSNMPVLYYK